MSRTQWFHQQQHTSRCVVIFHSWHFVMALIWKSVTPNWWQRWEPLQLGIFVYDRRGMRRWKIPWRKNCCWGNSLCKVFWWWSSLGLRPSSCSTWTCVGGGGGKSDLNLGIKRPHNAWGGKCVVATMLVGLGVKWVRVWHNWCFIFIH